MSSTALETLQRLAENVAHSKGLELVDAEFTRLGKKGLIRVFITKPEGVNVNDCSLVSRELDVLLEAEGLFNGPFTLEVSSPGLDKPLKKARDFERNLQKAVKLTYVNDEEKTIVEKKVIITDVVETKISFDKEGEVFAVDTDKIKMCKLLIEF